MKKLFIALTFGLVIGAYAHAAEPGDNVKVLCASTPFSDLLKIEIQETDLKGQYVMVETLYDAYTKKTSSKVSDVFSMEEIEKSELPELTEWAGYTRTLIRNGPNDYTMSVVDECTSSYSTISCVESF